LHYVVVELLKEEWVLHLKKAERPKRNNEK